MLTKTNDILSYKDVIGILIFYTLLYCVSKWRLSTW